MNSQDRYDAFRDAALVWAIVVLLLCIATGCTDGSPFDPTKHFVPGQTACVGITITTDSAMTRGDSARVGSC